ncbi:hypothetical protein [Nonomuraea salmonea]|uniref:hypothetical protein n=1 Tax=Nonomuraea salmonea TaxID=46181 RepID=UPI0031E795A1
MMRAAGTLMLCAALLATSSSPVLAAAAPKARLKVVYGVKGGGAKSAYLNCAPHRRHPPQRAGRLPPAQAGRRRPRQAQRQARRRLHPRVPAARRRDRRHLVRQERALGQGLRQRLPHARGHRSGPRALTTLGPLAAPHSPEERQGAAAVLLCR